jgi:Mn-dependent DtxR family transcriptional regulator
VSERLKECGSLRAKILVLRNQGQQRNCDIAKTLNIETHTVETEIWKIRKRGIVIPDARRSFLENLAF